MAKILQVTNAYPTNRHNIFGIFIKDQLDGLKEIGLEFDLFFINAKEKGKYEYYKAFKELKKSVNNYELIHCHHFLTAFIVLLCKPKAKVIVSFLSDGPSEFIIPRNLINNFITKVMFDFIVGRSDVRIFKSNIPKTLKGDSSSFHVPNGVDLSFFKPMSKEEAKSKLKLDTQKKYILFVSSQDLYRPEKRYDLYLKTIEILKRKDPDVEELAIDNVTRNELPYYYNAAEMHLLTSDFEGSPNSIKECLACNTPVVSHNVGSVLQILDGIANCFIVNNNTPEEFAKYSYQLMTHKQDVFLPSIVREKQLDKTSSLYKIKKIYKDLLNEK